MFYNVFIIFLQAFGGPFNYFNTTLYFYNTKRTPAAAAALFLRSRQLKETKIVQLNLNFLRNLFVICIFNYQQIH